MTAVIVPVYNKVETLRQTVPSVLAQDGVDARIWVDDGSTDGSLDVLKKLTRGEWRAQIVVHDGNRGRAAARNSGVAATDADTLVFFDADAVPHPHAAQRLADAVAADNAVAAVARVESQGIDSDDPYHVYLRRHPRGPGLRKPGEAISWRYFVTAACAVRADALRAAGGFDESIRYGEDLALAQLFRAAHPNGLVSTDASVDLLDVGGLAEALANVESFGLELAQVGQLAPSVYANMGLDVLARPGSLRYRIGASNVLASAARSVLPMLPEAGVASAVRYLLGHHLLAAHARARVSK